MNKSEDPEYRKMMRRRAQARMLLDPNNTWRRKARELKAFLATKKCICCGGSTDMTFDHILPLMNNKKDGKHWTIRQYRKDPSVLQFLCLHCNKSKNDTSRCKTHNKYLGVWNYLPKLDNICTDTDSRRVRKIYAAKINSVLKEDEMQR